MADRRWLFDGQPSGTAVTAGNTQSQTGNNLDTVSGGTGGTVVYDNAWSFPAGGTSIKMTNGTGPNQVRTAFAAATSTFAVDQSFRWDAEVPESRLFLRFRHSSGYIFSLARNTSGRVFVQNASSATIATGSVALPTTAGVRFEVTGSLASGANSNVTIKAYSVAGVLLDTVTLTGVDLGASSYSLVNTEAFNSGVAMSLWWDAPGLRDGSTTPMGSPSSAVMNAGPDQSDVEPYTTVTLDSSASTGSAARTWTQTAGTTVTLSSATATSPTFKAPGTLAGETLTFRVTDNASSTFDDVSVTVLASSRRIKLGGVMVPVERRVFIA